MEYDSTEAEAATNTKDLHVMRGLQELATGEMQWLDNVPPEALIEVRKQGAMDEIRRMLGSGVGELAASNPNNFHRTRDKIFDNINEAFELHQQNIKGLRAKQ